VRYQSPFSSKISFIFLLISIFTTKIHAQSYDLNTFKFRYQNYRFLNTDFSLSGNSNRNIYDNNFNTFDSKKSLSNYISYIRTKSKDKVQLIENLSVSTNFLYSRYSGHFDQTDSSKRTVNLVNNIFYSFSKNLYTKNLNFKILEFGFNSYLNPKFKSTDYNTNNYNLYFNFGIGKGRIENVSDAVTAIFIVKDLISKGISTEIDSSKIEKLASGVVEARNRRFLNDYRYQYIDQISLLDSICKTIGIQQFNSLKYFNILYDNLIFTDYSRETGGKLEFKGGLEGLSNRIGYYDYKTFENSFIKYFRHDFDYGINLNLSSRYRNVHQINSQQQRGHLFEINYRKNLLYEYLIRKSESLMDHNLEFHYNFEFIVQPNTRTFFKFHLPMYLNIIRPKYDILRKNLQTGLYAEANYFISRKTSLNCYLNYRFSKSFIGDDKLQFSNSIFRVSINHSIF